MMIVTPAQDDDASHGGKEKSMSRAFSDGDLRLSPPGVPESPRPRETGGIRMLFGRNEVTKAHWKPDALVEECYNLNCRQVFSFFDRKHHCRKCGNIFCANCSSYLMRLSVNAEPSADGKLYKVCRLCHEEFGDTLGSSQSPPPPPLDARQATSPVSAGLAPPAADEPRRKSLETTRSKGELDAQLATEEPAWSNRRRSRSMRDYKRNAATAAVIASRHSNLNISTTAASLAAPAPAALARNSMPAAVNSEAAQALAEHTPTEDEGRPRAPSNSAMPSSYSTVYPWSTF